MNKVLYDKHTRRLNAAGAVGGALKIKVIRSAVDIYRDATKN